MSPHADEWLQTPKFAARALAQKPLILLPKLPPSWGGCARLRGAALDPNSLVGWSNEPHGLSRLTVSREGQCEDSRGQNSYQPIEEDSACPKK